MNNEAPKELYINPYSLTGHLPFEDDITNLFKIEKVKYIRKDLVKEDIPYPPALLDYIKARIEDFESIVKESGDDVDLGYAIKILKSDLDMFTDW